MDEIVLHIDNSPLCRGSFEHIMHSEGISALSCRDSDEAIDITVLHKIIAVVSDSSGNDFIKKIASRSPIPIILMTGAPEHTQSHALGFTPCAIIDKADTNWAEQVLHTLRSNLEVVAWRKNMLDKIRLQWKDDDIDRSSHIALSVMHGLAERVSTWAIPQFSSQIMNFFDQNNRILDSDAVAIENEATRLGLPVCNPEELVQGITKVSFGFVEDVSEDGEAHIILLDDEECPIGGCLHVPLSWLPVAYRHVGAGVAWVERQYECGLKGRFEPASTSNAKPKDSLATCWSG